MINTEYLAYISLRRYLTIKNKIKKFIYFLLLINAVIRAIDTIIGRISQYDR
jgi:hypothetical protein